LRDFLDKDELKLVQDMETKVANLIEGFCDLMTDKEAYEKIKEHLDKHQGE
jgi:hypothetical protein